MFDIKELKRKTKEQLKGCYGVLFLCSIIYAFINGYCEAVTNQVIQTLASFLNLEKLANYLEAQNSIDIAIILVLLSLLIISLSLVLTLTLTGPFTVSFSMIYLGITRGEKPRVTDLFKGFSVWGKAIILNLKIAGYTYLWTLLFIIPGIVKSFSYSMASYILVENEDMSATEALKESERLMKGHKLDLLQLYISFLGWFLLLMLVGMLGIIFDWIFLSILVVVLSFIWIGPQVQVATANFYKQLKGDLDINETIVVALEAEKKEELPEVSVG